MQDQYPPPTAHSEAALLQQQQQQQAELEEQMNQLLEATAQMSLLPQVSTPTTNTGQSQPAFATQTGMNQHASGGMIQAQDDISHAQDPTASGGLLNPAQLRERVVMLLDSINELQRHMLLVQATRAKYSEEQYSRVLTQFQNAVTERSTVLMEITQAVHTLGMSVKPDGTEYNNDPAPGQRSQSVNATPAGQPTSLEWHPQLEAGPLPPGSLLAALIGVEPQEVNRLLGLSMYPACELRRKGVPGHIIDKVELHRAALQRTRQGQTRSRDGGHDPQMSNGGPTAQEIARLQQIGRMELIRGLPVEAFRVVYQTWCQRQNITIDDRMMYFEGRSIDLHSLHSEVLATGVAASRLSADQWSVIGGRLRFPRVQYLPEPGPNDPPRSNPGAAQHLQHVYKEYLSVFDAAYIRSVIKSRYATIELLAQGTVSTSPSS